MAEILSLADAHLAFLKALHVPGTLNAGADGMSRGGLVVFFQDHPSVNNVLRQDGGGLVCLDSSSFVHATQ